MREARRKENFEVSTEPALFQTLSSGFSFSSVRQALSCAHRATQVVIGRAAMLTSGSQVMLFSLHGVCGGARPHNNFHNVFSGPQANSFSIRIPL